MEDKKMTTKTVEELAHDSAVSNFGEYLAGHSLLQIEILEKLYKDCYHDFKEKHLKIMAWVKQQQSGMRHLLENYINPNSTAGEAIKLSLERLEKILGEK